MSDQYKNAFQIFTSEQITALRKGGKILHECLKHVATLVRPGVITEELDRIAESFIRDHGAAPAFKGYHGYSATLCTSINDVCVHGIPGAEELREGEIVGIDCGVFYESLYTDSALTVPVGKISKNAEQLLHATQEALFLGLDQVCSGAHIGDIGAAIHQRLREDNFDAVRPLTGHGLGATLHQFPDVPNFGKEGTGHKLPLHTIIAIEPISTAGSNDVVQDDDGWTLRTKDGALSAHFEHTVLVTEHGYEILT